MTVLKAIENRRSIRSYKPDDVPQHVLEKLLNAARLAPSGCAMEARKFIVVRDKETISKLAEASPGVGATVAKAPVVIVGCNLIQNANMRYFGSKGEDLAMFTNVGRKANDPQYWEEYLEHAKNHTGEYESVGIYDLTIAFDHLSLAAVGEGLGTCWIGCINEREYRKILSIPENVQARIAILLGYPDESPEPRPRKSLDEVVCYGRYS